MTTKKRRLVSTTKTREAPSLRCEDLEKALQTISDYFDRASCQFMLLGETGHSVFYEEGLYGERLEIGVKPTQLSEYAVSTLKNLIPNFGTAESRVDFSVGTIPVRMFVLRKDSDVFKYPDQRFYGYEVYLLPNPFSKYYKNREYFE